MKLKLNSAKADGMQFFVVLANGEEVLWDGACHNKEAAEIQAKYVKKFIN